MKIAYVVKRYPRFSETFIVNEILAHERAGFSVEIFALLPTDDTHFQNLLAEVRAPVTYLSTRVWKASDFWQRQKSAIQSSVGGFSALDEAANLSLRDVTHALELSQLVANRGITHLHAHFASAATTVARLAARLAGITYSFTAHAKDIFHEGVNRDELKAKFEDCAAAITVSEFNLAAMRAEFGQSAGKLRRVYNGLNLGQFEYEAKPTQTRQILAVGRLVEKKGFGDLIAACKKLHDRAVDFQCTIVGTGELEQELENQISAAGLNEHVELCGALPQRDVKALLRSAALFAAPCVVGRDGNKDGLPTVLLEAMAVGTPCVSTNVTGIPEVVIDDYSGVLLSAGDVSELANSMQRLLNNKPLRDRLRRNARHEIELNFDIDKNTREMRNIFRAIDSEHLGKAMDVAS